MLLNGIQAFENTEHNRIWIFCTFLALILKIQITTDVQQKNRLIKSTTNYSYISTFKSETAS